MQNKWKRKSSIIPLDLTHQIFGRLKVIHRVTKVNRGSRWKCLCSCGIEKDIDRSCLVSGGTVSCGCKRLEGTPKHGMSRTPEYSTWNSMKQRCLNEKSASYNRYGGRGISVCARWLKSFSDFYLDMGPKPSNAHSIDREDNDGNYTPSNCKWATPTEQANNTSVNKLLTYEGETKTLSNWSRALGVPKGFLQNRVGFGWSDSKILSEAKKETELFKYAGEEKTLAQWADKYRISSKTFTSRVRKLGWSIEKALRTQICKNGGRRKEGKIKELTYKGRTQTLHQWGLELGIPPSSLHYRYERGWSTSKILSKNEE